MGFVLDIVVAFIIRITAKWFWRIRSQAWPAATAKVHRAHLERHGYGCDVVRIPYSYRVAGERYAGTHSQPLLLVSGGSLVREYPPGKEITVRYNPDDPSRSVALI
jgi:hypothetical protein